MKLYPEDALAFQGVESYPAALKELGGEASLIEIARHVLEEPLAEQLDLGHVAACLLLRTPTAADPSFSRAYALPSAHGRDAEGNQTWRVERLWEPDDLDAGEAFLRARADEVPS